MAPPNFKQLPWQSQAYVEFVRSHPCCVTKAPSPNDPHHTDIGHATMGGKASDRRTVPLVHYQHQLLHQMGEIRYWHRACVDPEQVIAKLNADWIALGNNFDESSSKPKPKRRARPVKGRPMQKKKTEPAIEVACAVCQHPHGTFTKKTVPKAFVCSSCKIGQKVEKADWVSHTHKRNYPEGALQ